jgi:hypothetical protein
MVKPLQTLINRHYPDLRKTIGIIQKNIIDDKLEIKDSEIDDSLIEELYSNFNNGNPIDVREIWITKENEFQSDYQYLLKQLHCYVYKKDDISPVEKANIILEISDGLRDSTFVIDQELNFYATIIRIMKQLQKF